MHLWHDLARVALRFFMTQTDINGFLKRGSMFILSEQQFALLLRNAAFNQQHQLKLLLPPTPPNCRVSKNIFNFLFIIGYRLFNSDYFNAYTFS